jgi:hypothetical protein
VRLAETRTARPSLPLAEREDGAHDRTLQTEWAYRQVFTTDTDLTHALAPWLRFHNRTPTLGSRRATPDRPTVMNVSAEYN